jgi:hypothetical protein
MVDVGVALVWAAISTVSLRGLSALGRGSVGGGEPDLALFEGELTHEERYPVLEVSRLRVGGSR